MAAGIGAHHAGLELPDKRLVEELFMNRILRVVVATSVCWLHVDFIMVPYPLSDPRSRSQPP